MDKGTAQLAELKEEIADLESAIQDLTKKQAEMDKLRKEAHADHVQAKKDLEVAHAGVRKALSLLSEYYAEKDGDSGIMDQEQFKKVMRNPSQAVVPAKHSKSI